MERRKLGRTDMTVSVLGFGGSEIGYQRVSGRTVATLLDSALDAGLNVIDTAECYEDSEELIGKAVGARRRDFYLFTKCGHGRGWGRGEWRPEALLKSIERSLQRLRTDCVDLVQLHSCSLAELRKGDVMTALERARERGMSTLHRLQRRQRGRPLRDRVRPLRHAADVRQHRRSGGARPHAAPRPPEAHGRHREATDRQRRVAATPPARVVLRRLLDATAQARLSVSARPTTPPSRRRCASPWACRACIRPSWGRPSRRDGRRTLRSSSGGRCRRKNSTGSVAGGAVSPNRHGRVRYEDRVRSVRALRGGRGRRHLRETARRGRAGARLSSERHPGRAARRPPRRARRGMGAG